MGLGGRGRGHRPARRRSAPSPSPHAPSRHRTRRRSPPSRFPPRACARALPPSPPKSLAAGGEGEGGASREQAQGSLARSAAHPRGGAEGAGEGLGVAPRRCRFPPPPPPFPAAAAMAAPLVSPGHRSRFEQEQDRAVRALVRSVTGLPEEELGGGRFQTALNFAWSNFRSAPATPSPGEKLRGCGGPAVPVGNGAAAERAGPFAPPLPPSPAEGRSPRRWAGPPLCAGGLRCGVTRPAVACSPGSEGRVPCGCWGEAEGAVPRRTCRAPCLGAACRAPGRGPAAVTPSRLNLGLLGLFS